MKRIFLALVLACTLLAPAWAGFDEGWAAFERGDYATALRKWRPLAERGWGDAQFNLGLMYDMGQGVLQDYVQAVNWYRLAAEQGHAKAQVNLGFKYRNGQGVVQDYAEAAKWFCLAAEHGDTYAQVNLGLLYGNGQGVPQDFVQAHKWFNLAASHQPPGEVRDMAVSARDKAEKLMTPAQVAEAQRLAREWEPKKQQSE